MEFDAQTFVESLLPESALQKDGEKEEGESVLIQPMLIEGNSCMEYR